MTVALVGAAKYTYGTTTTISPAFNQAPTAGRLLIMGVTCFSSTNYPTCTTPTGWTAGPAGNVGMSGLYARIALFWKIAVGGDTVPSLTTANADLVTGAIIEEWLGLTATPHDADSSIGTNSQNSTSAGNCNSGPLVTTVANDWIWSFASARINGAVKTLTWGGGSSADTFINDTAAHYIELGTAIQSVSSISTYTPTLAFPSGSTWQIGAAASMAFKAATSTPSAPVVTAPNGGETVSSGSLVIWTAATNADGNPVTYDIDLSIDNGSTWVSLAVGVSGTSYLGNFSNVMPSATCLVRIRANNSGIYGSYDQSNAVFTVVANSLRVDVGSFTKTSGPTTGNQDIVIPRDLTTAPPGTYAIIFWTAGSHAASGTWGANISACIGFTTGPANSYASSYATADTAANGSMCGTAASAKCLLLYDFYNGNKAEADFVSFPDSTHMRINWTTNPNNAVINTAVINYIVLSGLSGAKVVDWTPPGTAIDKSVTGVGFTPDLVLNSVTALSSIPNTVGWGHLGLGVMNKSGQQVANHVADSNYVTTETSSWQQTDANVVYQEPPGNPTIQAHFKSMGTDGFTVNFSQVGVAYHIFSLCLRGVSSKIGAFTTAVATGSQAIDTRQGFTPKGALFTSISLIPTSGVAYNAFWSLGASDLTNERSAAFTDVNGVTTTQAKSVGRTDKALTSTGTAGATTDAGSVSATSPTQTTVNWTTKDATAREYLYLLLGDAGTDTFPAKVS